MKHKKMIIFVCSLSVIAIGIFSVLQHPSFGRLPQGARLERIRQSPHYHNGKFANVEPTPKMTSDISKWQLMLSFITSKKPDGLTPDKPIKAVKTDLSKLSIQEDLFVWFGHSSYLLQVGGKRFLVDPVLTSQFPMSLMFKAFKGTDIYSPNDMPSIDYLVITHDHWDHLDYGTVTQLQSKVNKVVCPLGVGEYLEYWGYPANRIIELDWDEDYTINADMTIHCLPSRHFSGRFLKENPTLWASFLIDGPKKVYLGGDGGYSNHFKEIGEKFPGIDLVIMENGQYNMDWRYIHTLPKQLPQAIIDLGATKALTVHHNKFALARHPWKEPETEIKNLSQNKPYKLLMPVIGEVFRY